MKKILALFMFFSISMLAFAQVNNMQELRVNGFSWYDSGSNIYSGTIPTNFHICTLDKKAVIVNSMGENYTIKENTCVVIGGTQLTVSTLEGGVMAKALIY